MGLQGVPNPPRRWREPFLAALRDGGIVRYACAAAGVNHTTVYALAKEDPTFAADFAAAREDAIQVLEKEARRRAVEGTDRPVYQGGELVGYVREFSDRLLEFVLKGARPEIYRDNVRVESVGPDGGPIRHQMLTGLDDHERAALRRAIERELAEREPEPSPA